MLRHLNLRHPKAYPANVHPTTLPRTLPATTISVLPKYRSNGRRLNTSTKLFSVKSFGNRYGGREYTLSFGPLIASDNSHTSRARQQNEHERQHYVLNDHSHGDTSCIHHSPLRVISCCTIVMTPTMMLTIIERWHARRFLHRHRREGKGFGYPTIIIGSPESIHDTIVQLRNSKSLGYIPIAVCPVKAERRQHAKRTKTTPLGPLHPQTTATRPN